MQEFLGLIKYIPFTTMQITSLYGGPLEFLFVVESTEDPAYHPVSRLLADYKVQIGFCLVQSLQPSHIQGIYKMVLYSCCFELYILTPLTSRCFLFSSFVFWMSLMGINLFSSSVWKQLQRFPLWPQDTIWNIK